MRTGVYIIAGCGYCTHDTHPAEMDQWSADRIADEMVSDLTVGIDGTGIKAGVIGEIGTSEPIHPNERKCLLAAALAFRQVPAAIYVHIYPWGKAGLEVADLLVEQGVNPARIVICHNDVEPDLEYIRALLERGIFVEFDNFGKEFYIDPADRGFADGVFVRDVDRVRMIKEILDWGYEEQLLVTNDICLKCMLHHYGGWGYDHILRNIVPMMLNEGISQEAIGRILSDNPKRVLGHS